MIDQNKQITQKSTMCRRLNTITLMKPKIRILGTNMSVENLN